MDISDRIRPTDSDIDEPTRERISPRNLHPGSNIPHCQLIELYSTLSHSSALKRRLPASPVKVPAVYSARGDTSKPS